MCEVSGDANPRAHFTVLYSSFFLPIISLKPLSYLLLLQGIEAYQTKCDVSKLVLTWGFSSGICWASNREVNLVLWRW